MPSPPGAAPGATAPPPQPVAQHPHRERPLERLDRRVLRVRHRGVHAAHAVAGRAGRPARRRPSRSTPSRSPADRAGCSSSPATRRRHPVRRGLGERAEADVGHPLADLDVAGADRGGERGGHERARPARPPRPGRSAPPLAGMVGSTTERRAKATALRVTASTALTLPARCGSVPVKSNGPLAVDGEGETGSWPGAAGRARSRSSRARPRRSTCRRGARRARPACGARRRRHLVERRAGQRRQPLRRRPGWRHLRVEVARPLVGRPRGGEHERADLGGAAAPAGCAGPPAGSRWRRPGSTPARRRRGRRGGPGWPPSPRARPSSIAGATTVMSLRWVPPANGSLTHHLVARLHRRSRARRWRRPPTPASTRGGRGCARPGRAACRRG